MKAILSTTLLLFGPTLVRGLCQKYVDAAATAAANLQSAYFSGGTYPSQPVWISAVDAWHLQRRKFLLQLLVLIKSQEAHMIQSTD